jgi:asparagine synthase (glutamine-hydrolysing)
MRHRGPDDHGVFSDARVALGMTRLAVIDLSAAAHQPMSDEQDTVWVVYNGETYNFAYERAALEERGHRFRSHSDTEVVLHLYLEFGDAFVERMRGMFALAVYDRRGGSGRERLLLARDHFGIKPLLYADTPYGLVFASEIKALVASGVVATDVDAESLWFLLAYGSVPQPRSILSGVHMLPAGHRMIVERGARRLEPFWQLPGVRHELEKLPYAEQVSLVRKSLNASIAEQIVSDVPIGAFLSGGIDSAALVGLMATATGATVRTFSVGFGAEGSELDETDAAARVARRMGTQHSRIEISGEQVRDRIGDFARALDQPSVDGLNSWLVSAFAAKSVTVSISGTGGDELFAGYPWFGAVASSPAARGGLVARATVSAAGLASALPLQPFPHGLVARGTERLTAMRSISAAFSRQLQIMGSSQAGEALAERLRRNLDRRAAERMFDSADRWQSGTGNIVSRVSVLCMGTYLQNQLLRDIDAVSMASSLEVRVPFLDVRVVETALSLPGSSKLVGPAVAGNGGSYADSGAKRVLIDAVRDVLPADIASQRKRGFAMPMAAWLQGPLAEIREATLSPRVVAARGLLDPATIDEIHRRFRAGKAHWALVWIPMMMELWCQQVLDAVGQR